MVRLEKILWEQLVNVKAFSRQRVIGAPSKWYNENRTEWFKVAQHNAFNTGFSGVILRALEPILAKFIYRWRLDIAHQRGLTLEDSLLFMDRELRRCYFFETVARQNLHPYTVLFMKKRRARYYKVERGLRGFYVPDWVRKEAEERQLSDTVDNIFNWENFIYREYMSDMTPIGRWTSLSKITPLDMFQYFGLFRNEAWDRFFYNEAFYESFSEKEKQEANGNPFGKFNLQTADGRAQFEKEVNTFIERYPFAVTKPGQKFDFTRFYALEDLANKRDTSKYDPALLESVKNELKQAATLPADNGANKTKKSKPILPEWLQPKFGKAFQA
ncbi:hypothetical protein ABPG74_020972 [Tetrahymena malaccensis]